MNLSIFLSLFGIIIIYLIVTGTDNSASNPITAKRYITNIYMYILLGLIIVVSTVVTLDKYHSKPLNTLGIILLSFVSLITVLTTNPSNTIVKHLAWVVFVGSIGFMSYPIVSLSLYNNTFKKLMCGLMFILLLTSYISYSMPLGSFVSWSNGLFVILCGLIVFELMDLIFLDSGSDGSNLSPNPGFLSRQKIYGGVGLVLFTGFLLYDTQQIITDGFVYELAQKASPKPVLIDYPSKSLNVFLDVINLFSSMVQSSN